MVCVYRRIGGRAGLGPHGFCSRRNQAIWDDCFADPEDPNYPYDIDAESVQTIVGYLKDDVAKGVSLMIDIKWT